MTLPEFLVLQEQLISAFGWLARWWLILFLVGVVFSAVLVWMIVTTQEMVSKV